MSHILLTCHVEILDLLIVTNYIRQNLTANFSTSPSCTLELPSWILFYILKMQRLTLLNLKWLFIISIATANLILYLYWFNQWFCILYWFSLVYDLYDLVRCLCKCIVLSLINCNNSSVIYLHIKFISY